jgi:hypothetical protein
VAEQDLHDGPRETYAGREGLKRNAREQLDYYREQYIEELRNSAAFIIVSGSAKDQFLSLAQNEFGCFSADPESFYKELANRLPQELYDQKVPAGNLFDILGRHLEDKAQEMKIAGYPLLVMKQQYARAINGREDFVQLIKQAINEQVGSEIVGLHTVRSLANEAIDRGHASKITPIVMVTDDETLALDLQKNLGRIGSRVFLVSAGKGSKRVKATEGAFALKEIDKEAVENTLANIRNLCKSR